MRILSLSLSLAALASLVPGAALAINCTAANQQACTDDGGAWANNGSGSCFCYKKLKPDLSTLEPIPNPGTNGPGGTVGEARSPRCHGALGLDEAGLFEPFAAPAAIGIDEEGVNRKQPIGIEEDGLDRAAYDIGIDEEGVNRRRPIGIDEEGVNRARLGYDIEGARLVPLGLFVQGEDGARLCLGSSAEDEKGELAIEAWVVTTAAGKGSLEDDLPRSARIRLRGVGGQTHGQHNRGR